MIADELRSAALLFARELADGTVSADELEQPAVLRAVGTGRRAPAKLRRARQIAMSRGLPAGRDDSVERMAAARRAVLGEDGAGPPRVLVRVDEFPIYDVLDDPSHGTDAFRRFHTILRDAGVPYLIATQAAVAERPLDPSARGGRELDDGERALLQELAQDEGMAFGLHGYDHRTRYVEPPRRSELGGRTAADLAALLDRGLATLAEIGIAPRVLVPPYNTFGAEQWLTLAERFAVITGGPESIPRMGYHRTPLWRGDAVYAPTYPPYYGRASALHGVVEKLVALQPGCWVTLTLHSAWEADDGFADLERLARALAPLARPWSEFLDEVDTSSDVLDASSAGEPLHIASVQTSDERGGGEFANVNMLEALAKRGETVRLLTNQPELAKGTSVPATELVLGPKLGTRTLKQTALGFFPGVARMVRALRDEARARGPLDTVMLHFKKEQLMSALFPPRLTRSIVWAEWGPLPPQLRKGLPRLVYLAATLRVRAIIAVSESTRESLETAGVPASKIEVIPTILDPSVLVFDADARARRRAEWGAGDDTFVFGCVSRLNKAKPLAAVVDALGELPGDVLLIIAGDGPNEEDLRRHAEPHGDRVRFLPVPRGYVEEIVSGLDVLVFAPQTTEGLPRAIMFGQLCSRPVITTSAAPVPGLVPEGTGSAVEPPNDAHALAELLAAYRDDPARREREGAAGRAFALRHYDPAVATTAIERVLRGATHRRRLR